MSLTSYAFIGYFILLTVLYYLVPKKTQWMMLLAGSLGFYFLAGSTSSDGFKVSSGLIFLALITGVAALTYIGAILIKRAEEGRRKGILTIFLLLTLAVLGVFKYTDFVIDNINVIRFSFGAEEGIGHLNLLLPLGISFYTFQSVGYLLDVYWEKTEAEKNFFRHLLFVSFLPQLIQGPISRHSDLGAQLFAPHDFTAGRVRSGAERMIWGYFKKLVIADNLAPVALGILGNEYYDGAWVLVGLILYSIELYADFSGGIDIAIGAAESLGITLAENFERPYFSKSLSEYWRRWHITMGTWFKDYVFFPVSTSKLMNRIGKAVNKKFGRKPAKTVRVWIVTLIVWLATGIWHGASWNFIVWGIGNGLVLLISGELKPLYDRFSAKFPKLTGSKGYSVFRMVRTFFVANSLTLLDVYRDVPMAFRMYGSMFTRFRISALTVEEFEAFGVGAGTYIVVLAASLVLLAVSILQEKGSIRKRLEEKPAWVGTLCFGILFVAVILFGAYGVGYDASSFIYNQF